MPDGAYVYRVKVDGEVRYIGKGRKHRAFYHEKFARQLNEERAAGRKVKAISFHNRLAKAIRQGSAIETEIVIDGLCDELAYLLEAELIAKSFDALWNEVPHNHGTTPESARAIWQRPGVKERHAENSRAMWRDPVKRERILSAHADAMKRVDKAAYRKKAVTLWADPSFREKQMAKWQSDDVRQRHSQNIKAATTEEKAKAFGKRVAESWRDPEKRRARLEAKRLRDNIRFADRLPARLLRLIGEHNGITRAQIAAEIQDKSLSATLAKLALKGKITRKETSGGPLFFLLQQHNTEN